MTPGAARTASVATAGSCTPETQHEQTLLRASLILVWWITVAASLWEWNGQSLELLRAGGVSSTSLAHALIAAGTGLDAVLALALMCWPGRWVYALTAAAVVLLTLLASLLLPQLWLHPIGPLSKNLPILAALWTLWRRAQ